jgi:uncharacterized protein YdgA (DUF945 family)
MRKLASFSLIIVGLSLATGLIMPKFVGTKAKSQLEDYMKTSKGAFGYTPELTDFQQGWFKSTATLNLAQSNGVKHTFNVYIKHGPVVFKGWRPHVAYGLVDFEPVISIEKQTQIDKVFAHSSTKPHFNGSMLITSANNVHLNYHVPSGNYSDPLSPLALKYDWKDLNTQIHFHLTENKLDKFGVDTNFGGMVINAGPQTMTIDPITFDLKSHQYKPGSWIWLGEASFKTGDITVKDTLKGSYTYSGILLRSTADIANNKLGVSQEIKVSSLTMNNLSGGPIDFKLSINEVDPDGWESFLTSIEQLSGQADRSDEKTAKAFQPLVKGGFVVSLDSLSVKLDNKILSGHGKFVLPPSPDMKDLATEAPGLIKKISLEFSLNAPVDMIKNVMVGNLQKKMTAKLESQVGTEWQEGARTTVEPGKEPAAAGMTDEQINAEVEQQLGDLVKRNILVQTGDNYTLHASIKDGMLYLNDKPYMDLVTMQPVTALNWIKGMVVS